MTSEIQHFDVIILGGGINGAGLFRDLSEQGVSCLLVEKNDYGSGTSAAPSRLIHGGLKYLETGEFGLVAQSTLERNLLLRNAPHSVTALKTVIPIFSWFKGMGAALRTLFGSTTAPRSRGAVLVKIGLAIYDFYGSRNRVMPRHSVVGRQRALADFPGLTPSIVAAGTYYDAQISRPERLVHELVADGLKVNRLSSATNYTRLESSQQGVLSFSREHGSQLLATSSVVVNAAGPWIDQVNELLGVSTSLIGGTKGSHLLLRHDELVKSLNGRMLYFEADDGRICLVFDYLGLAMIGSTDIPADDPDNVRCDDTEIDYMLASVQSLLPGHAIDREHLVYAYSGIRPLPKSDALQPGLISRDHSAPVIEADGKNRPYAIVSLVGGKWTTFRGFAEEVADSLLKRLARERRVSTRKLPIGGGRAYPMTSESREAWLDEASKGAPITRERLAELLDRYGTTATQIAAHAGQWSDSDRLPGASTYSLCEIDYLVRNESVQHLTDVIMRRTTLAITGAITQEDLALIAHVAGKTLDWNKQRESDEVTAATVQLTTINFMTLAP